MKLAPIALFTFNRLEHTEKTIESLKKNTLAAYSDLFIFNDGPRNEKDKAAVKKVREYIYKINGFKKVTIIEAEKNRGLAESVISGVTMVIKKYGKVIVVEDDLEVSELFLNYMNESLNLYQDRKDIWSISGYTPPLCLPNDYKEEVFLIKRGASWGWGTWEDRWTLNDWQVKDYQKFITDKQAVKLFNSSGTDMAPMLSDQMQGRIDSWAIRWGYNQFKLNKWTVYPVISFVKNIGVDMSGTHSTLTKKYDTVLANHMIVISKEIEPNDKIIKEFKKLYDLKFGGYLALGIKKIGLYKPARMVRNNMLSSYKKLSRFKKFKK